MLIGFQALGILLLVEVDRKGIGVRVGSIGFNILINNFRFIYLKW